MDSLDFLLSVCFCCLYKPKKKCKIDKIKSSCCTASISSLFQVFHVAVCKIALNRLAWQNSDVEDIIESHTRDYTSSFQLAKVNALKGKAL